MATVIKKYPKSGDEIRKAFLEFYAKKSHKVIPSSSLIPDDPTVLLTIAGMLPFKSVFLGLKDKPSNRATSSRNVLGLMTLRTLELQQDIILSLKCLEIFHLEIISNEMLSNGHGN